MRFPRRHALKLGLALVAVPRAASSEERPVQATARWLAGMAPLPGRPPSAEWAAYARVLDERWKHDAPRLEAMGAWAKRELAPLVRDPSGARPLFYPFAGPDALHAVALFPDAPRMLLVGLEPVGALPDPAQAPPRYFEGLGAALADVHRLTFFRTRAMQSDFQRDGVIGALVATIARMNGTVGVIETSTAPPSARVEWVNEAGQPRRLDYVQADLANAGWKANAALVAAVRALAPSVTFLKAASFLLEEPRFSSVRQAILDVSGALVQDDTGVPFHYLEEARWAMRFFGRYVAPTSPFEDHLQTDLREAFERRASSPLPFGVGYHVEARRSGLLVAVKGP